MSGPGERLLDVSDLEPPEPLVRTLAAAEALGPGQFLRMLHRRHPCLLGENLSERGFDCIVRPGGRAAVETLIWRRDDPVAVARAGQAAGEPAR